MTKVDLNAEFFKAREVAELVGVDPKTVYTWVNAGKVAHIRTLGNGIRIRGDEVRRMLSGQPVLGQDEWAAQMGSSENLG